MENQTKLPSPIALFKQTWHIYKQRFWVFMGISIVPLVLFVILGLVAGGGFVAGTALGIKASSALEIILVVVAILAYLAVIYIALWSQTALLFAIKDADQKIGFKQSFFQAKHKVFSLLGAALLVFLAVMGLGLVGGGIIFALYTILPKMPILSFIEGILGLILVLWMLRLAIEFSLASYVVVGDNTTALSAVRRSRDYIKGYWWRVFWRMMFILVIVVVYFIIQAAIVSVLTKIPGVGGTIISQLVSLVLSLLIGPFLIAYAYEIYSHIRTIKGESQIPADKSSAPLIILAVIVLIGMVIAGFYVAKTILSSYFYGGFGTDQVQTLTPGQLQQLQQMEQQ